VIDPHTTPLERIAAALERLAPPPPAMADLVAHPAYLWQGEVVVALRDFAPLPIDRLVGIDPQKAAMLANFDRLAAGHAAHDVLLWGARGTGKSALVASAVAAVQAAGGALALVEVPAERIDGLARLFDTLAGVDRRFAVFIDDLGFDRPGDARALRSLLEGGAQARPDNVRLVVTANRRHLVPRDLSEQDSAINPRDTIDDALALADRFGLSLGFHAIDQDGYLAIVARGAEQHGLPFDAADALQWATRRGSRSGRVAGQYLVELAGRMGMRI
jgi:predicted AAA+ superfamily ATPase